MTRVISIRIPAAWSGRATSAAARELALTWLRNPRPLVSAPAPGPCKLNLRLWRDEIHLLKRISGRSISDAMRGILALQLSADAVPQRRNSKGGLIGLIASGVVLLALISAGVGPRGGHNR
jgi:hypothetical protein